MHIVIASIFRNASHNGQVSNWLDRVQIFKKVYEEGGYGLNFVSALAVEGDSTDDTWATLAKGAVRRGIPCSLRQHDHGGPVFGSTEDPARMRALSGVGDTIITTAALDHSIDYVIYVESDLFWMPETFVRLIQLARTVAEVPGIVAPMIYSGKYPLPDGTGQGDVFYDIWGFRGLPDESRFGPFPAPYHPSLADPSSLLVEVASVGSCLCIPGAIIRDPNCQTMGDYALVGYCRRVRAAGYRIYAVPSLSVRHP